MKTVGYAIVGTGYFGAELGRIMKEQEGAKIVAVLDPENGQTIADELGCDVETDLDTLYSRDDVDAVIVATPNYLHKEPVVKAAEHALIDEDNSVRVIDAYVDSLDLIELGFKEYSGTNRGQAPYRRSDLLKLHIYGYLNKIRSSRSLEIECKRNLELMWLINAITPDHGTIAGFVKNNRKAFHVTLRNLTLILKGWGLIDGKLIAIDGTKIRAQNSKHNCITKSGLDKKIAYADEQINAYLMALEKDSLL